MSLYRTAVNKPVTTGLIFLAFAILGVFALMKTSIALLPDIEENVIMVMSSYPGASSEDVENNLTKVLENALNGVSDLKNLTSQSKENTSLITLEFKYGTDIEVATNNVRDKLDMVNSSLPSSATTPVIFKFSADDMPIYILSATATQSVDALAKILDDKVKTPLARVSGVGTITVAGAPSREIQVYCDPDKLQAYGLSVAAISSIIASENKNVPSGSIDIGSDTYTLRVKNEFSDPSELLDVVVGYSGGNSIYLKDVATIVDGLEERSMEVYTNGVRGAQIVIQKQTGANSVNVIKAVKKEMKVIEKSLPSDIKLSPIIDSSSNIINSINSLKETILITFLVVMLVVYVFLGRWRATFIIVLSIPISLLASLMYLYVTGNTLNIISMSALSIAIGMVVDDSIVVLENISTHLDRGERPKEAAVHGTSEVGISVIASTLTMLCVFLPLTMMSGMAGILFKQLGWIVSIIMIVSTVGALTLVPMLCSRMLSNKPKTGKLHLAVFGPIDRFMDKISRGYARLIRWAMNHRSIVVIGAAVIFFLVVGILGPAVKTEYFPDEDRGLLSVAIELPVGTSQDVTRDFSESFYKKIMKDVPEIQVCSYRLGQADSDNLMANMSSNGTYVVNYYINLGSMENRKRSAAEIADVIRADIKQYPEVRKASVTEGMGGVGGASSVKVEIYGYDFTTTEEIAKTIQQKMLDNKSFTQVILSRDQYTPEYQVDFDREKLAVNGLNTTTASSELSAAMSGSVMSYYREAGDEYNIRVRYAKQFRTSVEDIENIVVYNPSGKGIKVRDLGTVVESKVPPTIERKNRSRMITVTGIVSKGHALSEAVEASGKIISSTQIPQEVSTYIGGDYEDQQDMFKDMIMLMLLIVILVYIVMASQFESFLGPFVIMFSIPFAFVGVLLGLWINNTALGVMAMIGVIILLGIVVKNGIVLIDYTILCRERGMSIKEASITAARSRLRPILMTTLTTVLGMVPMAVDRGEGSEMWRSLGMTVCWGLTISTIITLVLIPTIYCSLSVWQERHRERKAAREAVKIG